MATYTAIGARAGDQPCGYPVGVHAKTAEISITTALSAGDIILMHKVQIGTRVLAMEQGFAAGTGNDGVTVQVGFDGSLSAFGSATSGAGASFNVKGCPQVMTRSDDANPRFRYITLQVQAITSSSATGKLSLTVWLTNDIPPTP